MQGKDTEAASVDNSQQNSCCERGPVSGESKRGSLCLAYYAFVVFLIMNIRSTEGSTITLYNFSFQKKKIIKCYQLWKHPVCLPHAKRKVTVFRLIFLLNWELRRYAEMLMGVPQEAGTTRECCPLASASPTSSPAPGTCVKELPAQSRGFRTSLLPLQHPSEEAHAEPGGPGAKNHSLAWPSGSSPYSPIPPCSNQLGPKQRWKERRRGKK